MRILEIPIIVVFIVAVLVGSLIHSTYGVDNSEAVLNKAKENLAKNENKPSQQVSTNTIQPSQTSPKADFTNSNFNILFANPNNYLDKTVDFTGKVFAFPDSGELQMYVGNTNHDTVVVYNETFIFTEDDCVKVTGVVGNAFEGSNAFSATRIVPSISAKTIDKIDCSQAINPPIKTVTVQRIQTKAGIKITLHKVEFSDKNTRLYMTVENLNGKASINFYDFNAKAIQGKRQFSTTYSYDVEYPSIKSDIPPGIQEDGVVLFQPLDYKQPTAKFQFQAARSDTYTTYDFFFTVNIPK